MNSDNIAKDYGVNNEAYAFSGKLVRCYGESFCLVKLFPTMDQEVVTVQCKRFWEHSLNPEP